MSAKKLLFYLFQMASFFFCLFSKRSNVFYGTKNAQTNLRMFWNGPLQLLVSNMRSSWVFWRKNSKKFFKSETKSKKKLALFGLIASIHL